MLTKFWRLFGWELHTAKLTCGERKASMRCWSNSAHNQVYQVFAGIVGNYIKQGWKVDVLTTTYVESPARAKQRREADEEFIKFQQQLIRDAANAVPTVPVPERTIDASTDANGKG